MIPPRVLRSRRRLVYLPCHRPVFNLSSRWRDTRTSLTNPADVPFLRVGFVLSCIAYIAVMNWSYDTVISPLWSYLGLYHNNPPLSERLLFSGIAILPAVWMPIRLHRPSQWIYLYLYVAVYVPCCIVPLLRAGSSSGIGGALSAFIWWLCLCMFALGAIYRVPLRPIRRMPLSPRRFWTMISLFLAGSYTVLLITYRGILHFVPSLDVRNQRMAAREVLANAAHPLVSGYSLMFSAFAVNPLLMAYGIVAKKKWPVLIGLAGQCLLYMCAGHRSILATIPLIFILAYATRYPQVFASLVVVVVTLGVFTGTIISIEGGPEVAVQVSAVMMRTLFIPAHASHVYYAFFFDHPQTKFSHIRGLGWLAGHPYGDMPLGIVIGRSVGQPDNNMNANLWADGFASAGFFGMAIATVLAGAAFYYLDARSTQVGCRFAVLCCCAHGLNSADLPIFSLVLSYGMLLTAFLLPFFPEITMRPEERVQSSLPKVQTRKPWPIQS